MINCKKNCEGINGEHTWSHGARRKGRGKRPTLLFELMLALSCLRRVTPGVKDTPFLGLARGAKEAEDFLTWSEFVGGEQVGKQEKAHSDLPRFRPPEG